MKFTNLCINHVILPHHVALPHYVILSAAKDPMDWD
jgi:hypothetical protein